MLDQSLEDDRIEQEELRELQAFSAPNMPRFEDVFIDKVPKAAARRQSEAPQEGIASGFSPDEKIGDNAVDYSEDSPDECER